MSTTPEPSGLPGGTAPLTALLDSDPPKVGDFWLDARALETASGVTYTAHDDAGTPVLLILLNHGAASDPAARDRLAGQVNHLHAETVVARGGQGQDSGRLAHLFRAEDDDPLRPGAEPLAPWVALLDDGSPQARAEARRILDAVDLSSTGPLGAVSGPGFHLPWTGDTAGGTSRTWPLPWPGRRDRAGWSTTAVAWLLMMLLVGLGLLIAVLLFQNVPPTPPPPPVPTSASSGGGSGSPPPSSSASPSQGSGSPSPSQGSGSPSPSQGSGSPSPSQGSGSPTPSMGGNNPTPSRTPSMSSPGGEGSSGSATPTRNPKL